VSKIEKALRKAEGEGHGRDMLASDSTVEIGVTSSLDEALVDECMVVFHQPTSVSAEYYKRLRTKIRFENELRSLKSLLITSAVSGEGKTTTALNLALALCQDDDTRVAIVDADLRHPAVHKMLGIDVRAGLSQVLSNGTPLDSAILRTAPNGLSVLPAGGALTTATEALGSNTMKDIINELKSRFDYVVVDGPPVLAVSDSILLGSIVDGVVLVVQADATDRKAVSQTIELLQKSTVIGFVLNRVEPAELGRYYGYGYQKYKYRYNHEDAPGGVKADR